MRRKTFILLLLAVSLLTGCRKDTDGPLSEVPLVISMGTKAAAGDGQGISNVLLVIMHNGTKVKSVYVNNSADLASADGINCGRLPVGLYDVYAYANIDLSSWVPEAIASDGSNFDEEGVMKSLSGKAVPTLEAQADSRMLLTGYGQVPITMTSAHGSLKLLRPVVRFNVEVHNHSSNDVVLNSLSFGNFNASTSYLFDHRDSQDSPVLPSGVSYRSLPDCVGNQSVPSHTDKEVFSTLLYENKATGSSNPYVLNMSLTMAAISKTIELNSQPLKMIDAETSQVTLLSQMLRNQEYTVVINIYYQELLGEFTVEVDNTTWGESQDRTSSWTFK